MVVSEVERLDGQPPFAAGQEPSVRVHIVSEAYFRTLGIPVIEGPTFTPADRAGSPPVLVVSAATARRFFPETGAIGRAMAISISLTPDDTMAHVVGVVGDVKHVRLREDPVADVYVSARQLPYAEPTVYLRAAGDPLSLLPSVRSALGEIARGTPLNDVRTERDLVVANTMGERVAAGALTGFAALALGLAALGVYGVVAHSVAQRRREVAVRLALGAQPGQVVRFILREGLALVWVGSTLGLIAALALGGSVATLLYGVAPRDPLTLTTIVALLLAIATTAILIPARRASRTDPMTVLRAE